VNPVRLQVTLPLHAVALQKQGVIDADLVETESFRMVQH
jgi:hypothetical protein